MGLVVMMMALMVSPGSAQATECAQSARNSGQCEVITWDISADIDADHVTLGATQFTPGSPGVRSATPSQDAPVAPAAPAPPAPAPVSTQVSTGGTSASGIRMPRPTPRPVSQCEVIVANRCRQSSPSKDSPELEVSEPIAPTSVSDLVSFSPATGSLVVEPGSWSLPRLPTNVYSRAGESIQAGDLLGWPIEVRFTPRSFRFTYGDGSSAAYSTGGGSWGSRQFTPTATSHVYNSPGVYALSAEVTYSVSYRFDGGDFEAVAGTITKPGGSATVRVLRVSSLLVDQGCAPGGLVDGRC